MFVSGYSTYIQTNTSNKTQQKDSDTKSRAKPFSLKPSNSPTIKPFVEKNIPINYVSNYKAFNNQQKLQNQLEVKNTLKYTKIKAIQTAQVAYADNSKMYSLLKIPKIAIDLTPQINKELPQNLKDIKEGQLRHKMVNTYISNENYYKITA